MRIISQDGTIDVNYDLGNLSIAKGAGDRENDRSIYFHSCSCSRSTKLATYSTEEKAKKAMEMLRVAYAGKFITNADISDDFNEQLRELMKGGFGTVLVKDFNDCKVEFNNLNGYFQFPADREIEV